MKIPRVGIISRGIPMWYIFRILGGSGGSGWGCCDNYGVTGSFLVVQKWRAICSIPYRNKSRSPKFSGSFLAVQKLRAILSTPYKNKSRLLHFFDPPEFRTPFALDPNGVRITATPTPLWNALCTFPEELRTHSMKIAA